MLQQRERGSYLSGMLRRTEKPGKEREWRFRRRTDGGYGEIFGRNAKSSEETGTRGGFSLGSFDDERSSTPKIAENNYVNVFNNCLINNSVNPDVHDLYKLVPEVNGEVRTEVVDNINNVMKLKSDFNLEVRDSFRPNGSKDIELREWEKNILMHLNNVALVERDDSETSYVKFKLFKRDIYVLALGDTCNLVKGTLVSSEFWKMIGRKMLEESNARVHTAEKGGKGLRLLGKEERIKFYLDGLDRRFEVEPIVIEGLNHAVNFGIEFFRQQEVSISCTEKEVKSRKVDEGLQCIQETFPFHD